MHDARFDKLAKLLVEYSTRLKRNENVLIEAFDVPDEMTIALVRTARKAGAIPKMMPVRIETPKVNASTEPLMWIWSRRGMLPGLTDSRARMPISPSAKPRTPPTIESMTLSVRS